jgi:hypothetical protein
MGRVQLYSGAENIDYWDHDSDGLMNGADEDDDNDGVSDVVEAILGTNPLVQTDFSSLPKDTDGDGITDAKETLLGTDPASVDSDGDGVSDDTEIVNWCTDPNSQDSDGDGVLDGLDVEPNSNATCTMPLNGLYQGIHVQP